MQPSTAAHGVSAAVRYDRHMGNNSVQGFLIDIVALFNSTIIPLIFAVAVFFFIWNAARYFVFNGANEAGQDSAKRLALYGIVALVIMLSLWGIVNMVSGAFGITRSLPICPDFNPNCFAGGQGSSGIFNSNNPADRSYIRTSRQTGADVFSSPNPSDTQYRNNGFTSDGSYVNIDKNGVEMITN